MENIRKVYGHRPYCMVLAPSHTEALKARGVVDLQVRAGGLMTSWIRGMVDEVSKEITEYKSFSTPGKKWWTFRVYAKESKNVPLISDEIFFKLGYPTAEHDIPYWQRAMADLAAEEKLWLFDSRSWKETLHTLVYDIETTRFSEETVEGAWGRFRHTPIDIIGYSDFDISLESSMNLANEDFNIELVDAPTNWQDREVVQLIAQPGDTDTELANLQKFIREVKKHDVIGGHNVLAFDNTAIRDRLDQLAQDYQMRLSAPERIEILSFLRDYTKPTPFFNFGKREWVTQLYPTTFDTYYAARRFYFYLPSFSLKDVAPVLGVNIPGRVRVDYNKMNVNDQNTLLYNKHDVQEQLGITMILMQQALPLAFVTCLPFEEIWPTGTTRLWDHMALIRSVREKKIFPPIYSATKVARETISAGFGHFKSRKDLAEYAKTTGAARWTDTFRRVVKYGEEMPAWIEYAQLIHERPQPLADMPEENLDEIEIEASYHVPGGLTIHPDDPKIHSDKVLYWDVVTADVGAMYPTILQSRNVGADTVTLCPVDQKPDTWVWFKKIPPSFKESWNTLCRIPDPKTESFAQDGVMIGIKIDPEQSVVSRAMTGVMKIVAAVKQKKKIVDKDPNSTEAQRFQWKEMYQSLKALRNAGTHGIVSAESVSCRQFNILAGALVTTTGQEIISETMERLKAISARITTTDTDGVYVACSRGCPPESPFAKILGVKPASVYSQITDPSIVKTAVEASSEYWRKRLNYPDFELEIETTEAAIFIKHKNYLYWEVIGDKIKLTTKGNSFKGTDKPNVARKALAEIMKGVLADNVEPWKDEDESRKRVKESIVKHTEEFAKHIDMGPYKKDDLMMIQMVRPPIEYKRTGRFGKESALAIRAKAVEKLLGKEILNGSRMRFVVCKIPLPGMEVPKAGKSNVKPYPFMWPIDLVDDSEMIDLEWYRSMLRAYIYGAFDIKEEFDVDRKQMALFKWGDS